MKLWQMKEVDRGAEEHDDVKDILTAQTVHVACEHQGQRTTQKALVTSVKLDGRNIHVEVDTGPAVTLTTEQIFHELWPANAPEIGECKTRLQGYSGEEIPVDGEIMVDVQVQESISPQTTYRLPVIVVATKSNCLLGRNWLTEIRLDWPRLLRIGGISSLGSEVKAELQAVLARFSRVFESGLGTFTGPVVKISKKEDAQP